MSVGTGEQHENINYVDYLKYKEAYIILEKIKARLKAVNIPMEEFLAKFDLAPEPHEPEHVGWRTQVADEERATMEKEENTLEETLEKEDK